MNMILKSVWIYAYYTARYAVTLILGYGLYLSSKCALYAPSNPTKPVFSVGCFQNVNELSCLRLQRYGEKTQKKYKMLLQISKVFCIRAGVVT